MESPYAPTPKGQAIEVSTLERLDRSGQAPRPGMYLRLVGEFMKNSLIRDIMFRGNFLLDMTASLAWMAMNLGFYLLIFRYTDSIGKNSGWEQYPFFVFLATTLFVNSLVQAFFMPNMEEFSELIRGGGLDFALLKPVDTQFLISFRKVEWSSLGNFVFAAVLLVYSLGKLHYEPAWSDFFFYVLFLVCGVAILYSLMICLAATSIWLGRNQTLYDFWFYITNFSRYPMEIYEGTLGAPLQWIFTYFVPILVVVNVPARFLARPLTSGDWRLAAFALLATIGSLAASRLIFQSALRSYRSASS